MSDRNGFASPSDCCASHQGDLWNVPDFLEIQSIVGKDRAETLLRSYILQLGKMGAFVREGMLDPKQLRAAAHDLKSISGQLGFEALTSLCESILAADGKGLTEATLGRLLALIDESADAARSYCLRLKAAA